MAVFHLRKTELPFHNAFLDAAQKACAEINLKQKGVHLLYVVSRDQRLYKSISVCIYTPAAPVSAICSGWTYEHWSCIVTVFPATEISMMKLNKEQESSNNTSSLLKFPLQNSDYNHHRELLMILELVLRRLVEQQIISLKELSKQLKALKKSVTNSVRLCSECLTRPFCWPILWFVKIKTQ